MKKSIVIITLFLMTALSCGSYFIYKSYLSCYKKDFQTQLITHKNTVLVKQIELNACDLYVNTKTILWEDDNKEIRYKNELFDIISIERQANKIILNVFSDEKESEIQKEFLSFFQDNLSKKNTSEPIKLLKQFLALKFIAEGSIDINAITHDSSLTIKYDANQQFAISTVFLSQETPPPNFFS